MIGATHLHQYQCSNCRTTATSSVLVKAQIQCRLCLRFMKYLWSEPITTPEQRALAERGVVQQLPGVPDAQPQPVEKKCAKRGCYERKPVVDMVHLPGIGLFCSEAHAEDGQREYEAFMNRLRQLREDHPELTWTNPPLATTEV